MSLSIIFITSGIIGVRLRESRQPIGRLRKTCKNAFPRTIPVSFGRLDTLIATESSSNVPFFNFHVNCNSRAGCGSPVVKVSNHGRHVMSSIPVPLKTRRVGQRCTLNLSRAETSSRWCGVVVRRGGASSGVVHVTLVQNYVVRRQKPS
ncbi:uncharacterized protein TNCV_910121 [Trichonephila clavipes]|uniref:Uncharacterized protein n=1 Tax=Trichonephila clavipes TaxID=2585209 RepID=A0A8X6W477_TRICX|nr:uncharacterized protein TNCV_910121 [Trichonephila clavipes]